MIRKKYSEAQKKAYDVNPVRNNLKRTTNKKYSVAPERPYDKNPRGPKGKGIFKEKRLYVNSRIINCLGPEVAVFMAVLLREYELMKEKGIMEPDGYFTVPYDKLTKYFNSSIHLIRKWRKKAQMDQLIASERRGSNQNRYYRRYYKINWDRLKEYDDMRILYLEKPMR